MERTVFMDVAIGREEIYVVAFLGRKVKKRRRYFNNLLHIHQHTFLKYMIHDTVVY